ncbi:PLP-dependent transferase [Daldinia grandis]|nr:PLP-dependent transferase [Daldinia grandis]
MATFDIEADRAKFPALKEDQVFLDNAGGSQILGAAVEAISDYLIKSNVQFGGGYRTSKASSSRYDSGVTAGAKFLNAEKDEIAFGPSTTQLLRNLSFTFDFHPGDEIIISSIDHEANIAPWKDLASRLALVLKQWTPQDAECTNPTLQPGELQALLTPKTRLVACTHASNVLGSIHDVKAIAGAVRAVVPQALLCVDGVAYAPHRPVDVKALGVDFYVLSWYKVYGPHVAMLYGSRRAQGQMRTLGHYFSPQATLENKVSLGSGFYELVQSIPPIVDYIGHPSPSSSSSPNNLWPSIAHQESQLQSALLAYLTSKPEKVTIYGERSADGALRLPTVSFVVAGWDSRELVERLERSTNYGFRWGAFYSNALVHGFLGLGPSGVVRVSMAHYNTLEEIKGFVEALDGVISETA